MKNKSQYFDYDENVTFGTAFEQFSKWYLKYKNMEDQYYSRDFVMDNLADDELELYWEKWQKEIELADLNNSIQGTKVTAKLNIVKK